MSLTCLTLGLLLQKSEEPLPFRLDRDIFTQQGKHFGLMPAEYVGGKGIEWAQWRPGNLLVINQHSIANGKPRHEIKFYDAPKKLLTILPLPKNEPEFAFQVFDDRTALVQFYADKPEDCGLYLVSNKGSRLLRTGSTGNIVCDGKIALAAIRRSRPTDTVKFLMVKGGAYSEFDSGISGGQCYLFQNMDKLDFGIVPTGAQPIDGRLKMDQYRFNTISLQFEKFEPKASTAPRDPRGLGTGFISTKILRSEIESLTVVGDEKSEFPSALIAADADKGEFSQERNFVKYQLGEHIFVREIRPVTDAELERVREQEESKRLLVRAKSLGTALAIYMSKNNDMLPGRNEKVMDLLMPIINAPELFTGFVYTFEGGSATAIAEPTKQVLGYIQGKYGRAVIYSDSHAKWESRKP